MIPTFAVRFASFFSSDSSLSVCKEIVVWVLTLIGFGPPDDENGVCEEHSYFFKGLSALLQQFRYPAARHVGVDRRAGWRDAVSDPTHEKTRFVNFGVATIVNRCAN